MNKMRHVLFIIICALVGISAFGQTAKQRIDFLKEHLVYPKYEIGDTVYVWLQTMDDKPIGYNARHRNQEVYNSRYSFDKWRRI